MNRREQEVELKRAESIKFYYEQLQSTYMDLRKKAEGKIASAKKALHTLEKDYQRSDVKIRFYSTRIKDLKLSLERPDRTQPAPPLKIVLRPPESGAVRLARLQRMADDLRDEIDEISRWVPDGDL